MAKLPELEYKIQEITDRIRELRTILGISVEEMARRLGLEAEDYQAYEAGEEELNFAFLYTCAQILGVDVTELIEGVSPRLSSYILTRSGEGRRVEQAHGMTYYNLAYKFRRRIAADAFIEYEEVYKGVLYGTLKSEVDRIWKQGKVILFDVDVKGGVNLKKYFGKDALSIFVKAPSIKEIRRRLEKRGTDSPEFIDERVRKARIEMMYQPKFDHILLNDDLATCLAEADRVVGDFLKK